MSSNIDLFERIKRVAGKKFQDESLRQQYIDKMTKELMYETQQLLLEPPKLERQEAVIPENKVSDLVSKFETNSISSKKSNTFKKKENSWTIKVDDIEVKVKKEGSEHPETISINDLDDNKSYSFLPEEIEPCIEVSKSDDAQYKYKVEIEDKIIYFGEYPSYFNVRTITSERSAKLMSVRILNRLLKKDDLYSKDFWESALHSFEYESEAESLEQKVEEAKGLIINK